MRRVLAVLVSLGLLVLPVGANVGTQTRLPSDAGPPSDAVAREHVLQAYPRLPLQFEANWGQTDPRVRFLARGQGYRLFLTSTEAVLTLTRPARSTVVRARLVGASPTLRVSGEAALPGKVNYFTASDPAKWRTNIPTYARVRYQAVYSGIDLVYYGRQSELEFDFIVTPGADPSVVTLSFEGADDIYVNPLGDLVLSVAGEQIRYRRPQIYQEVNGTRLEISGGYALKGNSQVGFWVNTYKAGLPLIIDPVLSYSTYLGGSSDDAGLAIAVDPMRNVYVTGSTTSSNFPFTAGAFDTSANGLTDAFVTKLSPPAYLPLYSTYLGGGGTDAGQGIAADASGSAYVTGKTQSSDFPMTMGAFDTTWNGGQDAFVTRLNATGSALLYSAFLGGSGDDEGEGIAVDVGGNAYVTGETQSANFPTTLGVFDPFANGAKDAFVTKVNPAGTALIYSTFLGGVGNDDGHGIAVDGSGAAYVAGETTSLLFPTTAGAYDTTWNGGLDAFVTKVNPTGAGLAYSTFLGGTGNDKGRGIAVDGSGAAYMTGETESSGFPTTGGTFDTSLGGTADAFVTKVNSLGSGLVYSTYLGGSGSERGFGIAVDGAGAAYVTGDTDSTNFPTMNPLQAVAGRGDVFVTKVNPAGTALLFSTYLGGSGSDQAAGIAVDRVNAIYVAGQTSSANFPTTAGAFDTTANGGIDAFVARIAPVVTIGLYNPAASTFFLRNTNSTGVADVTFAYGPAAAGWIPLAGDWNGDGVRTAGLYNPAAGTFFLRNSNTTGVADVTFTFGPGGRDGCPSWATGTGMGSTQWGCTTRRPGYSTFGTRTRPGWRT